MIVISHLVSSKWKTPYQEFILVIPSTSFPNFIQIIHPKNIKWYNPQTPFPSPYIQLSHLCTRRLPILSTFPLHIPHRIHITGYNHKHISFPHARFLLHQFPPHKSPRILPDPQPPQKLQHSSRHHSAHGCQLRQAHNPITRFLRPSLSILKGL